MLSFESFVDSKKAKWKEQGTLTATEEEFLARFTPFMALATLGWWRGKVPPQNQIQLNADQILPHFDSLQKDFTAYCENQDSQSSFKFTFGFFLMMALVGIRIHFGKDSLPKWRQTLDMGKQMIWTEKDLMGRLPKFLKFPGKTKKS